MTRETVVSRNLAMDAVRVTEVAAVAASRFLGCGDERAADLAAVEAMLIALKGLTIDGVIRLGERRWEEGPRLSVGEKVGTGEGPKVDVALMPLEGPTIVAKGEPNGLSIVAIAESGGFAAVPDIYMEKIAVGGGLPTGIVGLDETPAKNLKELARAKRVAVEDLVVCILDRPRHHELVVKVRETGARIMLIADGDVSGAVATVWPESGIDIYMGSGGAREGVLAAAALACAGGQMQARLIARDDDERREAAAFGAGDASRIYTVAEMVGNEVTFAATGVTGGAILNGVKRRYGVAVTHSLVMRSRSGTLHFVEAYHDFANGAKIAWAGS